MVFDPRAVSHASSNITRLNAVKKKNNTIKRIHKEIAKLIDSCDVAFDTNDSLTLP